MAAPQFYYWSRARWQPPGSAARIRCAFSAIEAALRENIWARVMPLWAVPATDCGDAALRVRADSATAGDLARLQARVAASPYAGLVDIRLGCSAEAPSDYYVGAFVRTVAVRVP